MMSTIPATKLLHYKLVLSVCTLMIYSRHDLLHFYIILIFTFRGTSVVVFYC